MTPSTTPPSPTTPSAESTESAATVTATRTATGAPRPGGPGLLGRHTVSRVGFGAMQLEHLHDDRHAAIALLRRAVELGVDHIDTAQFYGPANELLREALRPEDGVVIVTKVGADPDLTGPVRIRPAQRPEQLRATVEDNLKSLGTDQLAVVNLRRTDAGPGIRVTGDQLVDLDDQLAVMTAMRDEGKIGAIGLSAVTLDVLKRALPAGIVCVQNAYSLVARDDEDILELCVAQGIAWVPFFPLGSAFPAMPKATDLPAVRHAAQSLDRTPAQIALAWLLHHAPNVLLIPGTASAAHLEANLAVGQIHLDNETLAALDTAPHTTH